MKIQPFLSILAASLLVLTGTALSGCQVVSGGGSSSNLAGASHYYFPVHQSGVVADASVTTDSSGLVTAAGITEWLDPSTWEKAGGTVVGGDIFRLKMVGKNSTATDPNWKNYTFFYYNGTAKGWIEWTINSNTGVWDDPATLTTTAATPNLDLKMSNPLYAKAYSDACAAVTASTTSTDLVKVTITGAGTASFPTVTVGNNAAVLIALNATKALAKSDPACTYFPVSGSGGGQIGYKENLARTLVFFKKNPTADFSTATSPTTAWSATAYANTWLTNGGTPSTLYPSYTSSSDAVWTVGTGTDAVTGATYSDFQAYSMGLQTAYLYAIGDTTDANVRAAALKF